MIHDDIFWMLAHWWLLLMVIPTVVLFFAYCLWDGWGRYKVMHRQLEQWRRGRDA